MHTYVKVSNIPENTFDIMHLNAEQNRFVDAISNNRFVVAKGKRQSGKSITSLAYVLHQIIFTSNCAAAIVSNCESMSVDLLRQLKKAYEALPDWMQQGVEEWNQRRVSLENGSYVMAVSCGSQTLRGHSINLLMLDEMAFWPEKNAMDFWDVMFPVLTANKSTKAIVNSTSRCDDSLFDSLWRGAEAGRNGFVPVML